MQLTEFKKLPGSENYSVKFDDGSAGEITAKALRENCPCAECKGEEVLLYKFTPKEKVCTENSFIIEKAQMVGNYAIQFFWKDGHSNGIYKWEYLKQIIP